MQSLSKEQEDMMLNMEDNSSDDDNHQVPLMRTARFSMVKSSSSKSSLSTLFASDEINENRAKLILPVLHTFVYF